MIGNLTRAKAAERSKLLRPSSYQIELDLRDCQHKADRFRSRATVRFDCAREGAESFIDLTADRVSSIELNGRRLPLTLFDGNRVTLPDLADTNLLVIEADCRYSRSCEGLYRFADPADGNVYVYSNLETCYAQRVYACFDQPDMKSTFEFTVRCPKGWQVISTMAADQEAVPAEPGTQTWHFPPTPPISTYITAIAAGPYHVARTEHDGIRFGLFCRQSLAAYLDPAEVFEITAQGFDYFHEAFVVRYPFGKYDQIFVPEFSTGAMENAAAVTIMEDFIFRSRVTDVLREARAETVLHELAHMWFGNLVTMTWWDDLWLNESFATWASLICLSEATRWAACWTTFSQGQKSWAYRQDQLPSTHPIVADIVDIASVEVYFDGITYAKGAAVLKQLVAFVGLPNFLIGLRSYFAAHAWGNATVANLLDALEQASGRRLADWSKAWLETAGVNTLRPAYTTQDDRFTEFAVVQQAPEDHPVLRPHRIAVGLYRRENGQLRRHRRLELDIAGERTEVPELVGEEMPDLVLVNDDDLTFAKIRLDEHSLRTAISSVNDFADPLPAALCLAAAWDMCRDAEMPARDYVELAIAAARRTTDQGVLFALTGQAAIAVRRYADPGWRPRGLRKLATGFRELMVGSEPGSDKQLACARSFARFATSHTDLELLAGLLDGSVMIDGLVVDTELRWTLLRRLVSQGVLGKDAINAERDRDRTDAGERYARACEAALPDPAAKQAAWAAIVSGELSNATFRAVLGGFYAPDQDELLVAYAPEFFEVVAGTWRAWGPDMARFFGERGYPQTVITPEAVRAANAYLANAAGLPDPLRRLIVEGRDDVARALRCRERDAQAG